MPVEISVKNTERKKLKIPFSKYVILFILLFLVSATYFSDFNAVTKLGALIGIHKNFLVPYKSYIFGFDDSISESMQDSIKEVLEQKDLDGRKRFEFNNNPEIIFSYALTPGNDESVIYDSYLVPVGHLYWIKDGVTDKDLKKTLLTSSESSSFISKLLMDEYEGLEVKSEKNLLDTLEKSEDTPALVDISELTHTMKLLTLNGKYFFDDKSGGIKYSFVTKSESDYPDFLNRLLLRRIGSALPTSFDEKKIAKVNMTGVTAITRALATKTDNSGNQGYAAQKIAEFLKNADLTHVSNEVSFVPGCTPVAGVRFCSKPEYIKALEDSGVDIVELTGNHDNDYGASYNASSIEMYKDRGWDYFGGGLNDQDASKILYKEVNGNKLAFIGYNYYDTMLGTGALASDSRAGANSYSESKMKENIEEARENADIVIVDFQFQECYSYPPTDVIYPICYKPLTSPDQKGTFRKAVDFGADIVIGTQAHQPQTYEIYEGKLIFYGLGNLFFDQIYWVGTRHGLILTHYAYNGKLIQTRITTTNYGNDMQTYVSSAEERKLLLNLLRDAR